MATPERSVLWAAGLWAEADGRCSATIVTTASAGSLEWLHHRSPLLLTDAEARAWCTQPPEAAAELLRPMDPALRESLHPVAVDRRIGSVANDGPELIAPTELPLPVRGGKRPR